jgi:DNA (cytosine-5)-methyltransferase 1
MAKLTAVSAKMELPILVDLFCGCGGMSLGAARAGFNLAAGIDTDSHALAAHTRNFPKSRHCNIDLAIASGVSILSETGLRPGQVDVIVGGPPCQGFSVIGKRNLLDDRNLLIAHFFRIVREISPRAFVLENVPGILDERFASSLKSALEEVESKYHVYPAHSLVALEAGAPTLRRRAFIVGFRESEDAPQDFWSGPSETKEAPVVRQALDGLPFDINPDWMSRPAGNRVVKISRKGHFFESASGRIPNGVGDTKAVEAMVENGKVSGCVGTMHSTELASRYAALSYGQMDSKTKSVKLDPNGYCPTLRAGTGPERGSFQAVRPIHYLRPRVITPREAARLQGFPDWFQFDQTKWHSFRQIGNSVSPLVAEFVMKKVLGVINA